LDLGQHVGGELVECCTGAGGEFLFVDDCVMSGLNVLLTGCIEIGGTGRRGSYRGSDEKRGDG
jgi:hypothetical protein